MPQGEEFGNAYEERIKGGTEEECDPGNVEVIGGVFLKKKTLVMGQSGTTGNSRETEKLRGGGVLKGSERGETVLESESTRELPWQ